MVTYLKMSGWPTLGRKHNFEYWFCSKLMVLREDELFYLPNVIIKERNFPGVNKSILCINIGLPKYLKIVCFILLKCVTYPNPVDFNNKCDNTVQISM